MGRRGSRRRLLEPGGAQHLVGAHVALGEQPAAAAEAVVPALAVGPGGVAAGGGRQHLAAVAELVDLAGSAVRAGQEEGHSRPRKEAALRARSAGEEILYPSPALRASRRPPAPRQA